MLKKMVGVLALIGVVSAQAGPVVFDTTTMSFTVPEIMVGTATYKVSFRMEADGRFSISAASPVTSTSSGGGCTIQFKDSYGAAEMKLTLTKISRVDPSDAEPTPQPQDFLKLVGQVVGGTPFFCTTQLTVVQGGRQLSDYVFRLNADRVGPDSGYESCGTFQPGTQTVLYQKVSEIKSGASWFDPISPISLTYTPISSPSVTTTCTP